MNRAKPLHFGFLLLPQFSNLCLANAVEPLRAANHFAATQLYDWSLVSEDGEAVTTSSGLTIAADAALRNLEAPDMLFVVAGYDYRRLTTPKLKSELRRFARGGTILAGLDTGSYLLASAGLLNGHRATIHWQELESFAEEFLDIEVVPDRYVLEKSRITAGGATTTLDLMLQIIGKDYGEAQALDVAGILIYDQHLTAQDPQSGLALRGTGRLTPKLVETIAIMQDTVETPQPLGRLAREVGLSQRELQRLFRRQLQTTPLRYYLHLRLSLARGLLLETRMNLSEIATRSGFSSAATLSHAYVRHFGQAPSATRRLKSRSTSQEPD
ncbi:GlxA family transcriptional regulator [Pelagibius sp. Alg239-R121]|uniref:GlxA family transcriptional regulator n=1 Tax=Pelagibius sp. Alg239-R121 TaxID=2993448 RepID=UPI0024A73790|nr:GlxA family transcriptional regulator [Pelagibius sp. Alg239-R121]